MLGFTTMAADSKFAETFTLEIEAWSYGLKNFPGEMSSALVYAVLRELVPLFHAAVRHSHVFNVVQTAENISRAAKYLICPQEIAFAVLVVLPNPMDLNEDEQYTLAQIVDQAEQEWGGALERLDRKWRWEREKREEDARLRLISGKRAA